MTRVSAAWLILGCISLECPAAFAMDEVVKVPSRTISDHDFLRGDDSAAPPVTLTGSLSGWTAQRAGRWSSCSTGPTDLAAAPPPTGADT